MTQQAIQTTETTETFTVIVTLKDVVLSTIECDTNAGKAQNNAIHRFLSYVATAENVIDGLSNIAKETENKTLKSRCSELKAVYQASCYGLTVADTDNFHTVVKNARALLKDANIMPNGNPRKTESEKEQANKGKFIGQCIADGKSVEEASDLYTASLVAIDTEKHLIEDAVQAILIEYGHELSRTIAKALLLATKEDKPKAHTL